MSVTRTQGTLSAENIEIRHDALIDGELGVTGDLSITGGGVVSFTEVSAASVVANSIEATFSLSAPGIGSPASPVAEFSLSQGANGQAVGTKMLTEEHTLALANTSSSTIEIPAGALLLFASIRVITAVTTSAASNTFDLGVAGDSNRFGSAVSGALGTTNPGLDSNGNPAFYPTAAPILLSAPGVETFTAGKIRVSLHYMDVTVADS